MPFPDSERVIYQRNPLVQVICQLRFPSILRIDAEAPAPFQERVRKQYPLYQEGIRQELTLPNLSRQATQQRKVELGIRPPSTTHDFISADGQWTVGLTRDFLALSTPTYKQWEQFREHLLLPLESLLEEYTPPFFSRIGLRYQDVIQRSSLNLARIGWSELLKPYIAAELAQPEFAGSVEAAVRHILIRLENDRGQVRLAHGLVEHPETGESCYLVDSDFFTEQRTEIGDVIETLNYLNSQAGRLFRWCITDKLHAAMEPRPL